MPITASTDDAGADDRRGAVVPRRADGASLVVVVGVRPVTATDSSRGRSPDAGQPSAGRPAGEELEVIEVGHVEQLQVHALHAGLDERAEPVDDLVGRADQRRVAAQLVDLTADGVGAARDLRVVAAGAHHERRRVGQRIRRPAGVGHCRRDPPDTASWPRPAKRTAC